MEKDKSQKWEYIAAKVMNESSEKPDDFSLADQKDLEMAEEEFLLIRENAAPINFSISKDPLKSLHTFKRTVGKQKAFSYSQITRYAALIILSLLVGSLVPYFINKDNVNPSRHFSTMKVPKGQMAQLELPDGTTVWLNSETTIKYPSSFGKKSRDIELEGEAYFKVHTNPNKPFNIKTQKSVVQVTGTSLNVKAYKGETEVTTLVEGKVRLLNKNKKHLTDLKPGQSAVFDNYNELDIYNTNTENLTMWKDGKLYVDNVSLIDLSHMLERWYNVKIVINDEDLKNRSISGTVLKYKPVDQILEILTIRENIKFEVELVPNDSNIITIKKKS